MGSMNLLGFSLSPQEHPSSQDHSQTAPSRFGFNPDGISNTDVAGACFDLTSDSTPHLLNLPSYGIYEAFHRNNSIHATQDWKENYNSQNLLLEASCNNQNMNHNQQQHQQQQPKLENFLGGHSFGDQEHQTYGGSSASTDYMFPAQPVTACGGGSNNGSGSSTNNSIGLSMIKSWLRNQPPPHSGKNNNNESRDNNSKSSVQTLSLSMSTGSQSSSSLPLVTATASVDGGSSSDNKQPLTTTALDTTQTGGAIETAPRKTIDTFGQRTSIYRGVTRHRWTGRYEAHLWDNSCRREGQTRKGRQGGYDKEEKAARAYDLAALKYWGTTTTTNFPISHYEKELEEMKHMTRQEYVASLRRHHQHGRWQARIGRVAGNKDLYLGTFSTQEEAAEAYDVAAIKFRGLSAVTNFDMSRYDVKSILESTTLPIGSAAKRLKDMEQVELNVDGHRDDQEDHSIMNSHITQGINNNYGGGTTHHNWLNALAFHQPQPFSTNHYPYGQRLWCKQEQQDNSDASHPLSYPDIHQLQLGNNGTHNFFHSNSGLHPIMGMDSASIDNSSSNSVVYDGYGGSGGGYVIPMGATTTTVVASDGDQSQRNNNGFGENEIGYESVYGSNDAYHAHARNLYYLSQQQLSSVDAVKASAYDQGSSCNTWVPTAIPTLAPRSTSMTLYHGAPPFSLLHE
ncbi:hypothetical protein Fmac_017730 [Flemingia macrophylla]|uniref:AP2/ERF domain-containing protein n=1 Tax=Flemingia macrophylla TaxID=520843 RepID=A0ABD1M308_9FABA